MPSRATIEAATPKCPAGPDHVVKAAVLCARPMRWDDREGFWVCSVHGLVEPGEWLVLAQLGVPVSA